MNLKRTKYVHKVWQPVRMRGTVELTYVHNIVLVLEDGSYST